MGCVVSHVQCPAFGQSGSQADHGPADTTSRGHRVDPGRRPALPPWEWRSPFDVSEITGNTEDPDPSDDDTLRVEGVDFRVAHNTESHHTVEYDVTEGSDGRLVVRRGQAFTIHININRTYDRQIDDLRLVFESGDKPKRHKGTHVEFVLSDEDRPGAWGARLIQATDRFIGVTVFTPPECLVGKWYLSVDVVKKQDDKLRLFRYRHKEPFYLLFNPWCKEDLVYMASKSDLEEYVLNDKGKIYAGSSYRITGRPWVFGQFTGNVLDCCLDLLDKDTSYYKLAIEDRGNPVAVVRRLTALVNSPDEQGVLSGNWSGDYSGGVSPLTWTGSEPILDQFYQTKKPVKFGQCWVFSGVLTTVCRALGMPTRSVTNFSSAHDVDGSTTIDLVQDSDGNVVEKRDSVWNFHVWNEVWMARPDLPQGYGGWQACDATPQEESGGVYCCGPCPVRAIKEGEVTLPFDGRFIFAEVNADRITWLKLDDDSYQKIKVDKRAVGKNISAKSLSGSRQDLTLEYKHHEGSAAERVAVRRAQQLSSSAFNDYLDEDLGPRDVSFKLLYDADKTFVGDNFTLALSCDNGSQELRSLSGTVIIKTMYYTGVEADDVIKHRFKDLELKPGQSDEVQVEVAEQAYLAKLKDMCMLSFTVMTTVKETGQIFTHTDDARLRKPHLQIQGPSSAQLGEEFEVQVSFTNPLSSKLTNCYLELEAPGFTRATKYPQSDVDSKEAFTCSLKVKGSKAGGREMVFMFNSRQLEDINGTHLVHVTL